MDAAKVQFLFGDAVGDADPDDPEDRAALLEAANPDLTGNDLMTQEVVATQIAEDRPPEVWQVARRMLGSGLPSADVLGQITFAFGHAVRSAAQAGVAFDEDAYVASLAFLPLPQPADVGPLIIEVVRGQPGISGEDIDFEVLDRLGRPGEDELTTDLIGRVAEALTQDHEALAWLGGDRTVHVADLMAGIVLTHRMTPDESHDGVLRSTDLAGFNRWDSLALVRPGPEDAGEGAGEGVGQEQDDEVSVYYGPDDLPRWEGPPGWLDAYPPGTLLAVIVDPEGRMAMQAVEDPPADAGLVRRIRRAYEAEVDESDLPASLEEIVLGLLLEDRDTFSVACLPVSELCRLAGLEQRRDLVAHDPACWLAQYRLEGLRRILDYFEEDDRRMAVLRTLDVVDNADAARADLRAAMDGLRDGEIFAVVLDELFGGDDDPELLGLAVAFAGRLQEAAGPPSEVAVAHLVAAGVAERQGRVLDAESHVKRALEADPGWEPAVDRAAWYAFDRGDAAEAARLWRRLEDPPDEDLALARAFAREPTRSIGRNDACWCGSGRKYKVCHLGRPELPPLEDRFTWLCRKAAGFLERRGVGADADLLRHAEARALNEDPDSVAAALADPVVADVTLVEAGWFARFLAERGPLLPDDEARLAATWTPIRRTVYQVADAIAGEGVVLRDLRGGPLLVVAEGHLSGMLEPGALVCGRAVPDGRSHQFCGRVFPVIPGTEDDVLSLCDSGDSEELCRYIAYCLLPSNFVTREQEPLVVCVARVQVPDPQALVEVLTRHYAPNQDGTWSETVALDGEQFVRAHFTLDGPALQVTANSEARMERVLGVLRADLPGLQVVEDRREPVLAQDQDRALQDGPAGRVWA